MTQHLRTLIELLTSGGWEHQSGAQLADVGRQILERYRSTGWLEVIGRAETLVSVLGEFLRDTPPLQRLVPVLQMAEELATLLEQGQHLSTLDLNLLPAAPHEWLFVLVEEDAGAASVEVALSTTLRALGFVVERQLAAHVLPFLRQRQTKLAQVIVLSSAEWLTEHAAALSALCPPSATEVPLFVAVLSSNDFAPQLAARQAGAQVLLDAPVSCEQLLSELTGLAWSPRQPYRVLVLDAPPQLSQHITHLRAAGCDVLAGSEPAEVWTQVFDFAPEMCVVNVTLPTCRGSDVMALLHRHKRFARLPVTYLATADTQQLAACDANGEPQLFVPVTAPQLTLATVTRARQFRRFETIYEQRRRAWRELSDLKKALDRHAIVSVSSTDGTIISVNSKFCDISGYRREELIGRNHRLIKSGYHPPALFEGMWRTITRGHIWQGEVKNRSKDGSAYWVQATIAPILNADGQPERYISIRTDITEQKRLLSEQKRDGRLLELQRQALAQFIATQDLAATSSLLLDGLLILTKSAHGLILEVYEQPDGSQGFRPQAISGIAWTEHTYHLLDLAQRNGMVFQDIHNLFGTILEAGAAVIVNDFETSRQTTPFPTGHPPIHAFLGMPIRTGDHLLGVVGLANRPGGYDQTEVDFLHSLTSTYASILDAARQRAVAQQVIQELTQGRATAQPRAAAPLNPALPPLILIAEDNPTNQILLKMQLELLGYRVDIADNGVSAIAKWKAGTHDLLLTDLNMPGMDGMALARSIRAGEQEQGGYLPILALTAAVLPEVKAQCLAAGINDVLYKPITLTALQDRLVQWLPQYVARPVPDAATTTALVTTDVTAILDTSHLIRILGQLSPPHMQELVDLFTATTRTDLNCARQLLRSGAARDLALLMHKLKSSAQVIGAFYFATQANRLETAVNAGRLDAVLPLLTELEHALNDVETLNERIHAAPTEVRPLAEVSPCLPSELRPYNALIIDDDPIVRRQTSLLLTALGISEVLTVTNGEAALLTIERAGSTGIDLLITDLKMPGMDGIEFLRCLAHAGYPGDLIIASGVDAQLLHTVADLARSKGLHLRGAVRKPLTREVLTELLTATRRQLMRHSMPVLAPEITPADLREGIALDEFSMVFQPKVDANTLEVIGVEALARWQHGGQMIRPDLFISAAERYGLIAPLSRRLLEKTVQDCDALITAGFRLVIAFNLSATWLSDIHLPEFIVESLQASQLLPEHLILEITETTILSDLDISMDVLTRLRIKGFKLSIDDFGTGYSSMEQLQRIPFGELKIDRSFVQGAAERPAVRAILAASIDMAHKLNLTTVAEGVETQADLDLIRGLGCDLVQGWLIAKAMPMPELITWLQQRAAE
ncbi:response regulator receiver protein [Chromatium okenii]|uniref:EAL domain-containing protein n=1 Tax=Chromatium okenii TaxID=61644 RepID=UPI0019072510|nr:EAL domain-containing protein [Chromatium okenii]MBK1640847.1 response regulator receiver protein [Chromatium okenii]